MRFEMIENAVQTAKPSEAHFKYVSRFVDRHGKMRCYFRYKHKRVALPEPGTPAFMSAYKAALEGASEPWVLSGVRVLEPKKTGRVPTRFVYVICYDAFGPVKIGIATDLNKRLSQLQTGCPHRLKIAAALELGTRAKLIEECLHAALTKERAAGEWFRIDVSRAVRKLVAIAYAKHHRARSSD